MSLNSSSITSRFKNITLCSVILMLCLLSITFLTGSIFGVNLSGNNTSALTYSTAQDISFTINPKLSISLSDANLVIDTLAPGNTSTSNAITITVASNTPYGYALYADAGSNDAESLYYDTSNLIHSDTTINSTFTSIATNASLVSLDTDNTWGYSTSKDNGSTWSTYNGLPTATSTGGSTSTDNPAVLIDTKLPADSQSIALKVAARSSTTQASGSYSNIINFYVIGKPQPLPPANLTFTAGEHIDTLMIADINDNYKPFYVTPDSTSRSIPFTSPSEGSKYIITVVPESGYVLSSDSNNSSYIEEFSTGALASRTLLTTTYTVGSTGDNITISAEKIGSSPAYPAYATMQNFANDQCPAYTDITQGVNVTDVRNNKSYAIARLGNYCYMLSNLRLEGGTALNTTTSNVSNDTFTLPSQNYWIGSAQDHYCEARMRYINGEYYYNWYAAKANPTTGYSSSYSCATTTLDNASLGSICPAGWTLPSYNDITRTTLWSDGLNPGMLSTTGLFRSGSQSTASGYWWSSVRTNNGTAYYLTFSSKGAHRVGSYKSDGRSVRCKLST